MGQTSPAMEFIAWVLIEIIYIDTATKGLELSLGNSFTEMPLNKYD